MSTKYAIDMRAFTNPERDAIAVAVGGQPGTAAYRNDFLYVHFDTKEALTALTTHSGAKWYREERSALPLIVPSFETKLIANLTRRVRPTVVVDGYVYSLVGPEDKKK